MPNKLAVVTSFRGDHWNIYAKECIDSFVKNWPEDVKLYAYYNDCLLYTSPSPRDRTRSRMPSSA